MNPSNELRNLVDAMLDGSIRQAELARLEELLAQDEAAMDYYLSMAGQDGLLSTALAESENDAAPARRVTAWWVGVAAVLAIGVGIALWRPGAEAGAMAQRRAMVTDQVGVVWKGEAPSVTEDIGGRLIEIESGLIELTHASGTRLLLEGPAGYEVTGANAGRLVHGKLVAEVPPGAEGFTVDCPDGQVVDFGTEFAIEADPEKGTMEVGVFRGEVKVRPAVENGEPVPLYTGHAVRLPGKVESPLRSIPFDQERFVRRTPSRELSWYYKDRSSPLEWDVSHLVWSAGEKLAVLKWMSGPDALVLSRMELLLDGELVARDEHPCSVGELTSTLANVYRLPVPEGSWRRGKWVLRAWPGEMEEGASSEGILMLEDASVTEARAEDFVGVWEYVHDGVVYRRSFHEDGTCLLEFDGEPTPYFENARWEVRGGILEVRFDASEMVERHMLRDAGSLVFINQPYRNARRVK